MAPDICNVSSSGTRVKSCPLHQIPPTAPGTETLSTQHGILSGPDRRSSLCRGEASVLFPLRT